MAALLATQPTFWRLASTYGTSSYGSCDYSSGTSCNGSSPGVQIGPITLPVTGATIWAILGILLIALAVGLFVWGRQRRKRANTPTSVSQPAPTPMHNDDKTLQ